MKYKILKLLKYLTKISIILVGLLFISFLFVIGWYIYELRGREVSMVENDSFQIKLFYHPSGFGTSGYIKIYSYDKSNNFEETLLIEVDNRDSARIAFLDSTTVMLSILTSFPTYFPSGYTYVVSDSLVVDLTNK